MFSPSSQVKQCLEEETAQARDEAAALRSQVAEMRYLFSMSSRGRVGGSSFGFHHSIAGDFSPARLQDASSVYTATPHAEAQTPHHMKLHAVSHVAPDTPSDEFNASQALQFPSTGNTPIAFSRRQAVENAANGEEQTWSPHHNKAMEGVRSAGDSALEAVMYVRSSSAGSETKQGAPAIAVNTAAQESTEEEETGHEGQWASPVSHRSEAGSSRVEEEGDPLHYQLDEDLQRVQTLFSQVPQEKEEDRRAITNALSSLETYINAIVNKDQRPREAAQHEVRGAQRLSPGSAMEEEEEEVEEVEEELVDEEQEGEEDFKERSVPASHPFASAQGAGESHFNGEFEGDGAAVTREDQVADGDEFDWDIDYGEEEGADEGGEGEEEEEHEEVPNDGAYPPEEEEEEATFEEMEDEDDMRSDYSQELPAPRGPRAASYGSVDSFESFPKSIDGGEQRATNGEFSFDEQSTRVNQSNEQSGNGISKLLSNLARFLSPSKRKQKAEEEAAEAVPAESRRLSPPTDKELNVSDTASDSGPVSPPRVAPMWATESNKAAADPLRYRPTAAPRLRSRYADPLNPSSAPPPPPPPQSATPLTSQPSLPTARELQFQYFNPSAVAPQQRSRASSHSSGIHVETGDADSLPELRTPPKRGTLPRTAEVSPPRARSDSEASDMSGVRPSRRQDGAKALISQLAKGSNAEEVEGILKQQVC